jgi:hypothetical protein
MMQAERIQGIGDANLMEIFDLSQLNDNMDIVGSVFGPPVGAPDGTIDPDRLKEFFQKGDMLKDALGSSAFGDSEIGQALSKLDFKEGLAVALMGAPIAPPFGAIAGVVLWLAKSLVRFGTPPNIWNTGGPGVNAWMACYGPQAFADWAEANAPGVAQDLLTLKKAFVMWTIQAWKKPLTATGKSYSGMYDSALISDYTTNYLATEFGQGQPNAGRRGGIQQYAKQVSQNMPDWIPEVYAQAGIDWRASAENRDAGGTGFMLLNPGLKVRQLPAIEMGTSHTIAPPVTNPSSDSAAGPAQDDQNKFLKAMNTSLFRIGDADVRVWHLLTTVAVTGGGVYLARRKRKK